MKPETTLKLAQRVMPEHEWELNEHATPICWHEKEIGFIKDWFSLETNAEHRELVQLWLEDRYWDFSKYGDSYQASNNARLAYALADTHLERLEKAAEIELENE